MGKGWWRVDIDGKVFYQHAVYKADAVFGAMKKSEYVKKDWDGEFEPTLIGVERCEVPEGKRLPNPHHWLKPPGILLSS